VVLGQDVFVGPGAMFTNVKHPRAAWSRGPAWDRTIVGDGATIGANATLVAPLNVGRFAIIGAGAVVTKDVPDHAIVVGNPARIAGWACDCGETISRASRRPTRAVCKRCSATLTSARRGSRSRSP
jgi:UDP-2-acetamido-3-amino-2,3-dideoxy-glucuronate N-acetyltransferase